MNGTRSPTVILPVLRAITHAEQGLTVDEIVAATKAAGLASHTCRR